MEAAAAALAAAGSTAAAAPLTTAAVLASGYGAYAQARATNKAMDANAKAVGVEAEMEKQAGLEKEIKQRQATAALIGEQKVAYGASGVDITGGGTPQDIFSESQQLGDADALTIRSNTKARVESLREQQKGYLSQKVNPWMSAGTTILTNLAMGEVFKTFGDKFKMAKLGQKAKTTYQGGVGTYHGESNSFLG